ncbi:hypothetical protein J4E83_007223 [Alternaria metachromatica]|uniref:uncharacterized protein n=1 Tax=Alternaria metachromatica TaxID=283354 RepID=UPI0020C42BF0|nr:uncharacterized protein J4E83_007223 [Alternaria metachromatica]KAI4614569.1 hypothetical protein J4E83_007223 [Alternaria metachromatica]
MCILVDKVRKGLAAIKRISGPTWGATLEKRHQLYHGKLLAQIVYACAAWFLHDPFNDPCHEKIMFGISPRALSLLESLQIEMLLVISRAWKQTPVTLIEKEIHVLPILLKLHSVAMNHRCQKYDSKEYELIKFDTQHKHPFTQMGLLVDQHVRHIREVRRLHHDDEAELEDLWQKPAKRKVWVKDFTYKKAFEEAKKRFDLWARAQAAKPDGLTKILNPAYRTGFGDHCFSLYFGLAAAQQTMLLGLRTGNIGINTNPVLRRATQSSDMSCPRCGDPLHTIKHLMFQCPETIRHLPSLIDAASHSDFDRFMTEDTDLISSYAIAYFGLDQFDSVKDQARYQFPRRRTVIRTKGNADYKK